MRLLPRRRDLAVLSEQASYGRCYGPRSGLVRVLARGEAPRPEGDGPTNDTASFYARLRFAKGTVSGEEIRQQFLARAAARTERADT